MTDLATAISNAKAVAAVYVSANPENERNWYPCGFAYATYRCRKNAKEAAILKAAGFSWDEYRKEYMMTAYEWTNTQSMDYKEGILRAFTKSLSEQGFPQFGVRTYID